MSIHQATLQLVDVQRLPDARLTPFIFFMIFIGWLTVANLAQASGTHPPTQVKEGYGGWDSKLHQTGDEGCSTWPSFAGPREGVGYYYEHIAPVITVGPSDVETVKCQYMLRAVDATPANGRKDSGPYSQGNVAVIYDYVCDRGMEPSGFGCVVAEKKQDDCPATMNPISLATGMKFLTESAYRGTGAFPVTLSFRYESTNPSSALSKYPGGRTSLKMTDVRNVNYELACIPPSPSPEQLADPNFKALCKAPVVGDATANNAAARAPGTGWRTNAHYGVNESRDRLSSVLSRPDGKAFLFNLVGDSWTSAGDVRGKLIRIESSAGMTRGWIYTLPDGTVENYGAAGMLDTVVNRNGLKHTYLYDGLNRLASITDGFGKKLQFEYDVLHRIKAVTDPGGYKTTYGYDAADNLSTITYPDTSVKTFLYENSAFPHAITGVIDENGTRFISYFYDDIGRAYKEELNGGVGRNQLVYNSDGSTTLIDALGTARSMTFQTVLGNRKPSGQSQPGGAGCAAAAQSTTYDLNGNKSSSTNFNGVKTSYVYDLARNLVISETTAEGRPESRTVSTQWAPDFALPLNIAEPKRLTKFTYDDYGNVKTKTVQATTDLNGANGFAATLVGPPRRWSYSYSPNGQLSEVIGPRVDVNDLTRYTYDPETGHLTTITNALNHVTTISDYDANGRPGRINAPTGVVTEMLYTPRGWLASRTVTAGGVSEKTTYHYDGVGQLTQVAMPGGTTITYTYDNAHRMTTVADNLGNKITYTLDAIGNRIREEVKDADGVLTRQTTRVFDDLNRLRQQTGAAQ